MHMYMYVVTSTSKWESGHATVPNESRRGEYNLRKKMPSIEHASLLASCHAEAQGLPNHFTDTREDH